MVRVLLPWLLIACGVEPDGKNGPRAGGDSGQPTTSVAPGTPSGTPTVPEPDPTLELGTGEISHVVLEPGAPIDLVFGGQGGFHVEISGLLTHIGAVVQVDATVARVSDGAVLAGFAQPIALMLADHDAATGTGWFAGERALIENDSLVEVCALHGAELAVCATVVDLADPERMAESCVLGVGQMAPYERAWCGTN